MKKIFAYGTLLDPNVQLEVLGRILNGRPSSVKGYRVLRDYMVNGVLYPIAIEDNTSITYGRLFDIDDADMKKTDIYETNDYIRKTIITDDGYEAYMYVKPFNYERF